MTELNNSQKDFFVYTGLVGMGIGIGCLIQQLYIIDLDFFYAFLFSVSAIAGITAFTFLMLQKKEAGVLLIVALSLLFIRQVAIAWMAVRYQVIMFSLIQIVFFIYTIVILVLFFVNGYHRLLKQVAMDKKADEEYWDNTLK